MKQAANALSISRIIFLLAIFWIDHNRAMFLIFYLCAGLTDVLDGYVARKTHSVSEFGARLDSIADLCLFAVVLYFMIGWTGEDMAPYFPWIIAALVMRMINLLIAFWKFRKLIFIHTWLKKLNGLLVFLSPLVYLKMQKVGFLTPVCAVAILSAAEETMIHLTAKQLNPNRRSIFHNE